MHAFLLISSNKTATKEKISELFPSVKLLINYKIEKIADTKELIKQTNIALSEAVYILEDFDNASTEAQNAFLKRLEEPQENLYFVLTAKKVDKVLPTIISRCQLIRLANKRNLAKEDKNNSINFLTSDVPQKLTTISKITKREDAIEFLEKLLLSTNEPKYLKQLKEADLALARINQNGNPTLQLTNFVLSISLQ